MPSEKQWVKSLLPRLQESLAILRNSESTVVIESGKKLAYARETMSYDHGEPVDHHQMSYQTDLLVYDLLTDNKWVPRVVIEAKIEGVTTHDALTYSSKAATHKQVHPYLRYGIIIGGLGKSLPPRLVRHGAYFDFMMVFDQFELTDSEWSELISIVKQEIKASRALQQLLIDRTKGRKKYRTLHRPLRLSGTD